MNVNQSKVKRIIFLGDVQEYLQVEAKNHFSNAWLMTSGNYQDFQKESDNDIVVYTSLCDLPKQVEIILDIFSIADKIVYCPPETWSDGKKINVNDPNSSLEGYTQTVLLLLPSAVEIVNFNPFSQLHYDPMNLVDDRKTNDPQLWIAGCSISHGLGVEPSQRYGELLAKELNLQCCFLTQVGSSIEWAADQILRSDLRKDDILVWGITAPQRIMHVHQNKLYHITPRSFQKKPRPQVLDLVNEKELISETTIYRNVYLILKVVNYCEKLGIRLFLLPVLLGNYNLLSFLKSLKQYIPIQYKIHSNLSWTFEDLGTDLLHPGPKQHIQYKNKILSFIKN